MTQAPKEYTITESEILKIESMFSQPDWTLEDCDEQSRKDLLAGIRSRPHPAPAYDELQTANKMLEAEVDRLTGIEAEAACKAREGVQPFIDLVTLMETKQREMNDLMRRNELKIDNLDDRMQKLAFTFYSEIGEMANKADVVIKEYEESLRSKGGP
jgi:hypothetical protein